MRGSLAAAGLALAVLTGCTADDDGGPAGDPSASGGGPSVLGACAEWPDRAASGAETMPGLEFDCPGGGTLDLGRAPGVPTVVNLWASWCGPCRAELPLMQELAERAGDRVQVVGVVSKDGVPQSESFAEEAGATFPAAFDGDGELMAELGLAALPFTYFLDAEGGIAFVQVGEVDSVDELTALVAEHLGVQL
ncbi:TlpA family protein disulfide reductase [Trujillonella endophytica]|uniref:Thiol-disulfide isomerase or thioredoxin n=1 Tax=Trujillonella endophytica TaxID=673521 RepID=A0A1H8WAX9_9ACTN|nr:TlpA disulfide reductase family protein [Trujillella endophytica]SEP24673.1 Thiol-disulfide isomerase or thioredoxin [Trujillella endophytica]